MKTVDISIVIPLFNEAGSLQQLCEEIRLALPEAEWNYEVILVNDGSTDDSRQILSELALENRRIRPIHLTRNVGQSLAFVAGFRAALAPVIVTLDADLQNDPADIPQLVKALEECDLVSGIRAKREDTWLRKISSRLANGTRRRILGDSVTDVGCSLKAYRAQWLREVPAFNGLHRFLPCLLEASGARLREVDVQHRPRLHGESKYGLHNRLWRGLYDLVGVRWLMKRWQAQLPIDRDGSR